jgi:hypothetical protein
VWTVPLRDGHVSACVAERAFQQRHVFVEVTRGFRSHQSNGWLTHYAVPGRSQMEESDSILLQRSGDIRSRRTYRRQEPARQGNRAGEQNHTDRQRRLDGQRIDELRIPHRAS